MAGILDLLTLPGIDDTYDIQVFNSNFTILANGIEDNYYSLMDIIGKRYNYFEITNDVSFKINDYLFDGIYYLHITNYNNIVDIANFPQDIDIKNSIIIISNNDENRNVSEYFFSQDGKIFHRNVNSYASTYPAWNLISKDVIDNLNSTSTISSLSANQGRLLDKNKLGMFTYYGDGTGDITVNFDGSSSDLTHSGIYLCNKVSVVNSYLPELDSNTSNNFIVQTYCTDVTDIRLVQLSETEAPQFQSGYYYNSNGQILTTEPANWSTNYNDYYKKDIVPITQTLYNYDTSITRIRYGYYYYDRWQFTNWSIVNTGTVSVDDGVVS